MFLHIFGTSRDGKANQMLVEINPEMSCSFGFVRPKRCKVSDVQKKNHEITGFTDDTFVHWCIIYHIRPIRIHRYGEDLRFLNPKPFEDPGELNYGMLWDDEDTSDATDENGEPFSKQETSEGYSADEIIAYNSKITVLDIPQQQPVSPNKEPFCMPIDGVYWIDGRNGYLLSGTIESGVIELGDTIYLSNGKDGVVEEFDNNATVATPGDKLGILISGIKKGDLDGVENLIAEN